MRPPGVGTGQVVVKYRLHSVSRSLRLALWGYIILWLLHIFFLCFLTCKDMSLNESFKTVSKISLSSVVSVGIISQHEYHIPIWSLYQQTRGHGAWLECWGYSLSHPAECCFCHIWLPMLSSPSGARQKGMPEDQGGVLLMTGNRLPQKSTRMLCQIPFSVYKWPLHRDILQISVQTLTKSPVFWLYFCHLDIS